MEKVPAGKGGENKMTRDLPGAFAIVLASFVIGLGVNQISPRGIALKGQWDKDKGVIFAKGKSQKVLPELSIRNPLKVREIVDTSAMTIVDVRPRFAYDQGRIPGALSLPFKDFDQILEEFIQKHDKKAPLLLYCSGFACTDAHHAAARLVEKGFSRVKVFTGGFQEWEEMGFPIQ